MLSRCDPLCDLCLQLGFDVGLSAPPGSSNRGDFVFQGIHKREWVTLLFKKKKIQLHVVYKTCQLHQRSYCPWFYSAANSPGADMGPCSVPFSGLRVMGDHLQMGLQVGLHTLLSQEINSPEQKTLLKQRARQLRKLLTQGCSHLFFVAGELIPLPSKVSLMTLTKLPRNKWSRKQGTLAWKNLNEVKMHFSCMRPCQLNIFGGRGFLQ